MDDALWPLFGLRLRTPRLELRIPTDDDLGGMVAAVQAGVLGDEPFPFTTAWVLEPEPQRTRSILQFHWGCRSRLTADTFNLPFAVVLDGTIIGTQGIGGTDFAARRTVDTGSWIAKPWQGQGFAKEMRAAVLTLGFDHLGAHVATSGARVTTERSIKVSGGLGYRENGRSPFRFGDEIGEMLAFRLDVADWRALADRPPVTVEGWDACAPMFEPGSPDS